MQTQENKDNWIILAVRLLPDEKSAVDRIAREECRSMSSWVRKLILKELKGNKR